MTADALRHHRQRLLQQLELEATLGWPAPWIDPEPAASPDGPSPLEEYFDLVIPVVVDADSEWWTRPGPQLQVVA